MNGLRRNYIKSSHIYYIATLPLNIYNSNRVSDFLNSALCIMNYAFNAKQKFILLLLPSQKAYTPIFREEPFYLTGSIRLPLSHGAISC